MEDKPRSKSAIRSKVVSQSHNFFIKKKSEIPESKSVMLDESVNKSYFNQKSFLKKELEI